jgi:hypothetical protein
VSDYPVVAVAEPIPGKDIDYALAGRSKDLLLVFANDYRGQILLEIVRHGVKFTHSEVEHPQVTVVARSYQHVTLIVHLHVHNCPLMFLKLHD